MKQPHNSKNSTGARGCTIVELLIVIVVIAILAAISIVAYNGIQERGRNASTEQSAFQLDRKVRMWQTVKGSYPSAAAVAGGLVDDAVPEARIDTGLASLTITNSVPTKEKPVEYKTCAGYVGGKITYFVEGGSDVRINRGECP